MVPPTLAQRLLIALGVDHAKVLLGHHREKSATHTKRGPGRRHQQGKPKEARDA